MAFVLTNKSPGMWCLPYSTVYNTEAHTIIWSVAIYHLLGEPLLGSTNTVARKLSSVLSEHRFIVNNIREGCKIK